MTTEMSPDLPHEIADAALNAADAFDIEGLDLTDDAASELLAAEVAAAEAEATVAALERRVLDPEEDDDVTVAKFVKAENESRFARLRAEAARRKAARDSERARRRDVADYVRRVREFSTAHADAVVALEARIKDEAYELERLKQAHNDAFAAMRREGQTLADRSEAVLDKQQQIVDGVYSVPKRGLFTNHAEVRLLGDDPLTFTPIEGDPAGNAASQGVWAACEDARNGVLRPRGRGLAEASEA